MRQREYGTNVRQRECRLPVRAYGSRLCLTAALLAASLALLMADDAGADADSVQTARLTLEKLIETRRLIAQEQQDWALGREMLQARLDVLETERVALREKTEQINAGISEADTKRAEFIAQNEQLKTATAELNATVAVLEKDVAALLALVPEILRERVRPLSQRFADNPAQTTLSLAERFQNVVGVLNEVNKFNRDLTLNSEVRPQPDGRSVEVTAIYLGLGQAYYVNVDGSVAGRGTAGASGWTWEVLPQAAGSISAAVAMLKNEKAAAFVPLPVSVP